MAVTASSEGNVLGFRVEIDAQSSAQSVRQFGKGVQQEQQRISREMRKQMEKDARELAEFHKREARMRGTAYAGAVITSGRGSQSAQILAPRTADEVRRAEQVMRAYRLKQQAAEREVHNERIKMQRERDIAEAKAARAVELAERNRVSTLRQAESMRQRGLNQAAAAMQQLTNSTMQAARGFAYLGLVGEENLQKVLNTVLAVSGGIDAIRGTFGAFRAMGKLAQGRNLMAAGSAGIQAAGGAAAGGMAGRAGMGLLAGGGMAGGAGVFGLGAAGTATIGVGLAAGAGFAGMGYYQMANGGFPVGGAWDRVGGAYVGADRWLRRNTGVRLDQALIGGGADPLGGGLYEALEKAPKTHARQRETLMQTIGNTQFAVQSGIMRSQHSTVGRNFDDVRAGFMPETFGLMAGSVGSLRDKLGRVTTGMESGAMLSGIDSRIKEAQKARQEAQGNRQNEIAADENLVQLGNERVAVLQKIAAESQNIMRISQQEANIARERLQSASTSLGLMGTGDRNRLKRLGTQMQAVSKLEGPEREAAMARFSERDLQALRGVGLESTTKFVDEAAATRSKELIELFGSGERATIKEGEKQAATAESSAGAILDKAGVGKANEKLVDRLVTELTNIETENIRRMGEVLDAKLKVLRAEITKAMQEQAKEQNQENLAMRSARQSQFIS